MPRETVPVHRKAWCIEWHDRTTGEWGTCAVGTGSAPPPYSDNTPTKCGVFIVLPSAPVRGVPTCAECREALR